MMRAGSTSWHISTGFDRHGARMLYVRDAAGLAGPADYPVPRLSPEVGVDRRGKSYNRRGVCLGQFAVRILQRIVDPCLLDRRKYSRLLEVREICGFIADLGQRGQFF